MKALINYGRGQHGFAILSHDSGRCHHRTNNAQRVLKAHALAPIVSSKALSPNINDKFDLDNDGVISEREMDQQKEILELELQEEKARTQKNMAWVAMISMCIYAILPLMPFVPESRLSTLASLSDMLFLSQASVVGLYFGATAYMAKR